ncbi:MULTISPECIES: glutathione ABC transporter permease GsiC [Azorhizobium]|uniref:Glutathione transport system permease protein GsiC n=1 Tax=Azorhizobium caulinodans (strain ATCC 43989 / DSM 5975 / JCM 20966 / LMG 6465 / NBRC 14845 / NCIMB 13405 / ORS 571) TaxID=438753 RepID=A8IDU3_AZOC5|nr:MULTISPECIES: glutathione ABC transporter permease GsiC [Azorhizobium]TDT93446.1 glutathione transport system permease protein [Azorhizobium sp. AG788]BAF88992.1 ABC transporter permease protein [Azorhizobium caulinodans ORS 571]
MLEYLVKRLLGIIPVIFAISVVVFAFVHLLPGDPARLVAGVDASPEDVAAVRQSLGLEGPLWQQYVRFAGNALQGDFGISLKTRRPVITEIGERLMPTVWLTVFAMIWATIFGLLIGVLSAVKRGRWQDYGGMIIAVSGISFPSFWLGLLLIDLFSVRLGWLPTGGYGTWAHFVMPSFTLGLGVAAVMARFTRSAFVEIAREDYVRTARAKGVPEKTVIWKHTLRNALVPVITMTGLQFGFLLGGSIVVETVFSWPGLGRLLVDSVSYRDYPVIQAEILLFSLEFIFINLAVDVLYAFANPEIRYK